MRLSRPVLAIAAIAAVAAAPVVTEGADASCTQIRGAETATTDDDVEACRSDVFFHDAGVKLDNIDAAQGSYATWDGTAPSASVTAGAGAGAVATSVLHQQADAYDERESFTAAGRVEGALDNIVVELYLVPPAGMAQSETTYRVDAQLELDGYAVSSLSDKVVEMTSTEDGVQVIRFSFTGLADTIDQFHGFGIVGPLGGGHDLQLTVHGTGIGTNGALYVYDTSEVPAGMVFNAPASLLAEVG